jgi:hypothetical protein
MRLRKGVLTRTFSDDPPGFQGALAALIARAKLLAKPAHVVYTLFPHSLPDLSVGNVLADTNVHDEIEDRIANFDFILVQTRIVIKCNRSIERSSVQRSIFRRVAASHV